MSRMKYAHNIQATKYNTEDERVGVNFRQNLGPKFRKSTVRHINIWIVHLKN
ncbi:hypothetical protein SAMN06298216_4101 [Spirosomataceae bacterium TFI 002]|nr:hypothetical protein SAMN06298216_4101 [Spirosomataceae bacterium TFI 002]